MSGIYKESRSIWAYERRELWFNRMLNENFGEHSKRDFRMTRNTFLEIVRIVQPVTEKRDTQLCRVIPIENRRLSRGNSFPATPQTFAVRKSTPAQITHDFYSEIQRLASRFIKFPNTRRETASEAREFSNFVSMPNTSIRRIRWYSYSNYSFDCWRKIWLLQSEAVYFWTWQPDFQTAVTILEIS